MTAQEAIHGFQELSRRFGHGYKWGELEPIWQELLQLPSAAMVTVVGILMKNGRSRPSPKYVLDQVKMWASRRQNTEAEVVQPERARDPDAVGWDTLALIRAKLAGEISEKEWAQELYKLSELHGKPGFASTAYDVLKGKQ